MMLYTSLFLILAVSAVNANRSLLAGGKPGGTTVTATGRNAGTATPPAGVAAATLPPKLAAFDPTRAVPGNGATIYQFDMTGQIQAVTPFGAGPDGVLGTADDTLGSIIINDITITVPLNMIVQFSANTLDWNTAVSPPIFPSGTEAHVIGNIVSGSPTTPNYIAGLIYISQEMLNSGQGFISNIDYTTGNIMVNDISNVAPMKATLQINDPNGRYGFARSPDPRFSVDDANPTITSSTGYPMCIPRTDPKVADDALCPQRNRPRSNTPPAGIAAPVPPDPYGCRRFTDLGVTILPAKAGDINPGTTPGTNICNMFVMPPIPGAAHNGIGPSPGNPITNVTPATPDPRQQAPLMVGDYITWQGTGLFTNGTISVHTIEANVGIYTFPGTFPAYIKNGDFGFSSGDNSATSANGIAQETRDRFFLETSVTDYYTPIDIYLVDYATSKDGLMLPRGIGKTPPQGTPINRWITPFEMTGEQNGPAVAAASAAPVGGGITTSFTGVLISRDRIRATKAPNGYLTVPTRNVRTVYRSLCLPPSEYLSGTVNINTPNNVNNAASHVFTLPGILGIAIDTQPETPVPQSDGTTPPFSTAYAYSSPPTPAPPLTCVQNGKNYMANGLYVGQYMAPIFSYIFPENIHPGDPIVPNNLWNFAFLVNGEGGGGGLSPGGLVPSPY